LEVNTTTEKLSYITFKTDMGWIGISGSTKGLLSITLPQPSVHEVRQLLGDSVSRAIWSHQLFDDLMERLKVYFSGHRITFADKLDLSAATPFQHRVWEKTRQIPFGETRSYSWVAREIGQPYAVRAVGQALGRNPLPVIIPCHRVITADGNLGGYAGGLNIKKHLLNLEATAYTTTA